MSDTIIQRTFTPMAMPSETPGEFYPTVKVEGWGLAEPEYCQYIIGLSEAAALTFARDFAKEMKQEFESSIQWHLERLQAEMKKRGGGV